MCFGTEGCVDTGAAKKESESRMSFVQRRRTMLAVLHGGLRCRLGSRPRGYRHRATLRNASGGRVGTSCTSPVDASVRRMIAKVYTKISVHQFGDHFIFVPSRKLHFRSHSTVCTKMRSAPLLVVNIRGTAGTLGCSALNRC